METITLELDHDLLHKLMLMAHERDITLNQLFNDVVRQYIDDMPDSSPE